MHVKGYAEPETKGAIEQARVFIEQSEALGEPPEDPLLLFSALYGVWVANYVAFNGDICRDLAAQFLTLAEKKRATVPLLMAHAIMGHTSLTGGDFNKAREHYDKGIALYDPSEHRPLATRFGQDIQVAILSYRSLALWLLGFPEAALKLHWLQRCREPAAGRVCNPRRHLYSRHFGSNLANFNRSPIRAWREAYSQQSIILYQQGGNDELRCENKSARGEWLGDSALFAEASRRYAALQSEFSYLSRHRSRCCPLGGQ
jgi:hypothetical protein